MWKHQEECFVRFQIKMHGMADKQSGIKPNGITFVGLLNACRGSDLMVKEYGAERKIEHYGCLLAV